MAKEQGDYMSILPTWPIAAGALAIGLAVGAYADHKIMQGRLDKIQIAHLAELSARDAQRIQDEVAERKKEQVLVDRINEVEQRRIDENERLRTLADSAIARVQQRPDRKPTPASGASPQAPTCEAATGAQLSRPDGEFLIRLAQRADEQREALKACYAAYDSLR